MEIHWIRFYVGYSLRKIITFEIEEDDSHEFLFVLLSKIGVLLCESGSEFGTLSVPVDRE